MTFIKDYVIIIYIQDNGGLRCKINFNQDNGGLRCKINFNQDNGGLRCKINFNQDNGGLRCKINFNQDNGGLHNLTQLIGVCKLLSIDRKRQYTILRIERARLVK